MSFPLKLVGLAAGQGKEMPGYSSQRLTEKWNNRKEYLSHWVKTFWFFFFPLIKMDLWVSWLFLSPNEPRETGHKLRGLYFLAFRHQQRCSDAVSSS